MVYLIPPAWAYQLTRLAAQQNDLLCSVALLYKLLLDLDHCAVASLPKNNWARDLEDEAQTSMMSRQLWRLI